MNTKTFIEKEKRENDGLCHSSLLVSINIINENRMPMK